MNFQKTAWISVWLLLASIAAVQTASAQRSKTETFIRSVIVDWNADELLITGTNFGDTEGAAGLAGPDGFFQLLDIKAWSNISITAELLSNPPGNYKVIVLAPPVNVTNQPEGQKDVMAMTIGEVRVFGGNVGAGTNALISNTGGDFNSAYGTGALQSNTIGQQNTATGYLALLGNISGGANTATGFEALAFNTTGSFNTASGNRALKHNTTGSDNTATGYQALFNNRTIAGDAGNFNTASGSRALSSNTTGSSNTASGASALLNNTTGSFNTVSGTRALRNNSTGSDNTAFGFEALINGGFRNIAIGYRAGVNVSGSDNILIGHEGIAGESRTIRIGAGGIQNTTFITGIRLRRTGLTGALPVLIDGANQLGTKSSSRRYKEDIEDMAGASDSLLSLRPVIFRYKKAFEGDEKPIQYGLIAEDVAEVFPDLVVYNEDGEPEAVKYHWLATLLLNEFQKLEQVTTDQEAQLASLVEQNRAYESERERLIALEAKVAELTAMLAQSVTPVSEVQLASK